MNLCQRMRMHMRTLVGLQRAGGDVGGQHEAGGGVAEAHALQVLLPRGIALEVIEPPSRTRRQLQRLWGHKTRSDMHMHTERTVDGGPAGGAWGSRAA